MTSVGTEGTADTSQLDQLVALAIQRAYEAFHGRRLGRTMRVGRPDVTVADVADLGGPVDEVDAHAIDRWLPHATTTWGTGNDLRALVPRTLELFATGRLVTPPEVVLAKIHRASVDTWWPEERAAVEDLLTAVWLATLASEPPRAGHPAWRLLVALAELDGDLTPFLDDWTLLLGADAAEGDAARHHLRTLERRLDGLTDTGLGIDALFWSHRPREADRLEMWLDTATAASRSRT
jgi:hypothetical protein